MRNYEKFQVYDRSLTYNVRILSETKLPFAKQKFPRPIFWEKNLKFCAM